MPQTLTMNTIWSIKLTEIKKVMWVWNQCITTYSSQKFKKEET